MPNDNCLAGWECPMCENTEKFEISAMCRVDVTDDGTDNSRDFEWGANNIATCKQCEYTSFVRDFTATGIIYIEMIDRVRKVWKVKVSPGTDPDDLEAIFWANNGDSWEPHINQGLETELNIHHSIPVGFPVNAEAIELDSEPTS